MQAWSHLSAQKLASGDISALDPQASVHPEFLGI